MQGSVGIPGHADNVAFVSEHHFSTVFVFNRVISALGAPAQRHCLFWGMSASINASYLWNPIASRADANSSSQRPFSWGPFSIRSSSSNEDISPWVLIIHQWGLNYLLFFLQMTEENGLCTPQSWRLTPDIIAHFHAVLLFSRCFDAEVLQHSVNYSFQMSNGDLHSDLENKECLLSCGENKDGTGWRPCGNWRD